MNAATKRFKDGVLYKLILFNSASSFLNFNMKKYYLITLIISSLFFSCNESQKTNETKEKSSKDKLAKKEIKTGFGIVKFDDSITGFKFTTMLDNKFLYSPNGAEDLNSGKLISGFYFKPLIGMDYERSSSYLQDFSFEFGKQDNILKTENIKNKVIDVGNCKGFLITLTAVDKTNKTNFLTQAVLSNGSNAILFFGNDLDNGLYSEKFLNTINSVEF
jgi:hypothetical protein